MTSEPEPLPPIIIAKGKRAQRRQDNLVRDPGHLRVWYQAQGVYDFDRLSANTYSQVMHSTKHSCHSACCACERYKKRRAVRRLRYDRSWRRQWQSVSAAR